MPAASYDITIEQNATFELDVWWTSDQDPPMPVNVSGFTGKMQIRNALAGTLLYTLTTLIGPPPVTFTSSNANGGITVGTTNNLIIVYIPDWITDGFTWTSGVYDLDLTSTGGFTSRVLQGNVSVMPAVTTIANSVPTITLLSSLDYGLDVILN